MIPYIIIFLLITYCAYKYDVRKEKKLKFFSFVMLCLVFILFVGLRYKIGGDTLNYMRDWGRYRGDFWNFSWAKDIALNQHNAGMSRYQPLWLLYMMFFRSFGADFWVVQLFTAGLLNVAIFRTVWKYAQYPFLSILIFYLTFSFPQLEFEVMRESVAISVFLLISYEAWMEKKWIYYYVGVIFAYLFHPSALIMFILPLLRNLNWTTKKYILCFYVPSLILGIAGKAFMGDLIGQFLSAGDSISFYHDRAVKTVYNINYLISALLSPTILVMMVLWYRKYINSYLLPLIFLVVALQNLALFDFDVPRFANYIIIPVYISMASAMREVIRMTRTIWIVLIVMFAYSLPSIYVVYKGGAKSTSRYFPYQTILCPDQTGAQKRYYK